jgi:hypothetical protein
VIFCSFLTRSEKMDLQMGIIALIFVNLQDILYM